MIVCCGKDSLIIFHFPHSVREKKKKEKLNARKTRETRNERADIESVLKAEVEYKMHRTR